MKLSETKLAIMMCNEAIFFHKNAQSVPENNNEPKKANMEKEIKQWSTGKAKELE